MEFLQQHIKVISAHVKALYEIKAIKKTELSRTLSILRQLEKKRNSGKLREKAKGGFLLISNHIFKKSKNLADKLMMGASQKDQTITAKRLFIKDMSKEIQKTTIHLAKTFLSLAENNRELAITKNSSLAHWALSFTESLYDDASILKTITLHQDKSPLGSLDGFGTELLIPRDFERKELKMKTTQINSIYCARSQEKFERLFIEGMIQIAIDLDRFATDFIGMTSKKTETIKIKKSLRDLTGLKKIQKNSKTMMKTKNSITAIEKLLESLQIAQLYAQNIKQISSANHNPTLAKKISLGAAGNLDIHYYKRLLYKI